MIIINLNLSISLNLSINLLEVRGPSGPQLLVGGPSGRLDFVLRALRALRPCDPRSFSQEGRHEVELPKNMDLLSLGSDDDYH